MSRNRNLGQKQWIRWLGVTSSIAILFRIVLIARHGIGPSAVPLVVGLGLLPAFVSVFTSLAKYFWPNLIIGLWFLFVGIMLAADPIPTVGSKAGTSEMLLLLAALTLSSTPILNIIFAKKEIDKVDSNVNSE